MAQHSVSPVFKSDYQTWEYSAVWHVGRCVYVTGRFIPKANCPGSYREIVTNLPKSIVTRYEPVSPYGRTDYNWNDLAYIGTGSYNILFSGTAQIYYWLNFFYFADL